MLQNQVIKKLNTHEDSFYIHKILGLTALCNYIYRFLILITQYDMKLNNYLSMTLLVIHLLLSLSSLLFKLSKVRNRKIPIIYPEFRMHNIIFALRSVLCCFSFYYFQNISYNLHPSVVTETDNWYLFNQIKHKFLYFYPNDYSTICNICICFLTMKAADIITDYYKTQTPPTTTMRHMPYDENMGEQQLQNLKKVYSFMQLYATYYMLGNINSAYSPMFAIQCSSFLMTLVKKNIIPPMLWHPLYFTSLMSNIFVFLTLSPIFILKMNFACSFFSYWRMNLGYNKYIGWLIVFVFHYFFYNYPLQNNSHHFIQRLFIVFGIIYHYTKYSPNTIFQNELL